MEMILKDETAMLDQAFIADAGEVASFLVNAMYLFGDQRVQALGGFPAKVTAELLRMGHAVEPSRGAPVAKMAGGGLSAGRVPAGRVPGDWPSRRNSSGGYARGCRARGGETRMVQLERAIGFADQETDLDWLRSMRRDLAPGGLLCFHAWDRDRAWGRSGSDTARLGEREYAIERRFDPRDGRVRVSLRGSDGDRPFGAGSAKGWSDRVGEAGLSPAMPGEKPLGTASVRAYNLAEIEAMLQTSGLRLERAYGDWTGGNPEESGARTGRLIIVASKPRGGRKYRPNRVTKKGRPIGVTSEDTGKTI